MLYLNHQFIKGHKSSVIPIILFKSFCITISLFLLSFSSNRQFKFRSKIIIYFSQKENIQTSTELSRSIYFNFKDRVEYLRSNGIIITWQSTWLNAAIGFYDNEFNQAFKKAPFIKAIYQFPQKENVKVLSKTSHNQQAVQETLKHAPWLQHNIPYLKNHITNKNLKPGAKIKLAIIDNGFLLGHSTFQQILLRNQVIDQWDFVNNNASSYDPDGLGSSHGAQVLAIIGATGPKYLGIAPNAQFLLYRAEDELNESWVEEEFVASAIERAVNNGVQIINISLGYRYDFDTEIEHPFPYFDGNTGPASVAAQKAATQGVLVIASIGNEENNHSSESNITSPADADSIISVTAVNQIGEVCNFASRGKTSDGRIKPDISALGCPVLVANPNQSVGAYESNGTSFATPIISGIAILLLQAAPWADTKSIRRAILFSGDKIKPDTVVGWGMVDAKKALSLLTPNPILFLAKPNKLIHLEKWIISTPQTRKVFNFKGQYVSTLYSTYPSSSRLSRWKSNRLLPYQPMIGYKCSQQN